MTCRLVICRPQPGADETAAHARRLGMTPIIYPLFTIEPIDRTLPPHENFDALMLTSANAVRHAGPALAEYAGLPAFAVGDATAHEAKTNGLTNISTAGPNAQALAEHMARAGHKNVLHLCGEDVRPIEAGTLHITRVPVYRATETDGSQGLAPVLELGAIILIHSPRAGARIGRLIPADRRADLSIIAISTAALEAAGTGWVYAEAADMPHDAAMLALAHQICQKGPVTPSQVGRGV